MNPQTKYPVLIRHNAAKPLGKVTSIRSGKGRMEVTGVLNPRGHRLARKLAQREYGHKPSAVYRAMNQGPLWKREKERNEMLAFWGAVILLLAMLCAGAYIAGAEHTRDRMAAMMGN